MGHPNTLQLSDSRISESLVPFIATLGFLPVDHVEGWIFTRITMTSMTGKWYLPITHFEAILVGLVILEIFVMRYFLILPLDVTKLIEDGTLLSTDFSPRKKRMISQIDYMEIAGQQRLAETMFTLLRRLDKDDCLLRILCELEFSSVNQGITLPKGIANLLSSLKRLGRKRLLNERMTVPDNITIAERKVLSHFEEAVLVGSGESTEFACDSKLRGETCASYYTLCTAEKDELLDYVRKLEPLIKR